MPKRMVVLNYQKCDPQFCQDGVCQAALLCKRKVLSQIAPHETPELNSEMCLGCAVCTTACAGQALEVLQW